MVGGCKTSRIPSSTPISQDAAVSIAREDAKSVFKQDRELEGFAFSASLRNEGWHVEMTLKEAGAKGGRAYYLIDSRSGRILKRSFEQ